MLIDGKPVAGRESPLEVVDPTTGEVVHCVHTAGAEQVDAAVRGAARAAPQWAALLPHQRASILRRISELMSVAATDLATLQMRENGKVWKECLSQAKSAAATFLYYASVCETSESEVTPARGSYVSMVVYEPYGVVAAITPWNSPLTMEAQKVAPALAAGNAVVLKPSEQTPSTALLLGSLALEAGLPPGVLNVLPGTGKVTGAALIANPGVRMISFTGGTESGARVASVAAARLVPVALELGGKSPHIVFPDADLDLAAKAIVEGVFEGVGQSCVAGSRLFVQRSVERRLTSQLVQIANRLRVGPPDAADSDMGPLSSHPHRNAVAAKVDDARRSGAEVLVGGSPPLGRLAKGAYYLPTILTGIDNRSPIAQKEIFGPVLCVIPFEDEDDLVQQANDSVYGLAAGIWTASFERAWRIARRLEAGTVWINTYKQLSIATPFGGFKQSGIGREKGLGGMRLYQQSKSMYWGLNGEGRVRV